MRAAFAGARARSAAEEAAAAAARIAREERLVRPLADLAAAVGDLEKGTAA